MKPIRISLYVCGAIAVAASGCDGCGGSDSSAPGDASSDAGQTADTGGVVITDAAPPDIAAIEAATADAAVPDAGESDVTIADAHPVDGSALDATATDATTGSLCAWDTPFDSVTEITELASAVELRLSRDELTGYFYQTTGTGAEDADIFVTHRTSLTLPFATPTVATDVGSTWFDGDPFLSADGLTVYLESDRPGSLGETDIFVGTRTDVTAAFSALVPVANVNSTTYDGTPYVSNDGSELWLATNRAGSIDVYRAHAEGTGFGAAESVTELNSSASDENNPVLMADGLTIYFASNRTGTSQVYVAHRATMASAFGAPTVVSEVNSSDANYPSWISADGCRLYITRFVASHQYVATRH
ncbi:MAG: TolB family protein [Polyangiales bacterium]